MKRIVFLLPILLLSSCSPSKLALKTSTYAFSTLFDIRLYEGEQKDLDNIVSIIQNIEASLSSHDENAELYKLNNDRKIDNPSIYLKESLSIGLDIENRMDTFSIYLGSLKQKWMDSLSNNKVLGQDEINIELGKIKGTCIDISSNSIALEGEGNIDLGSIGKGYCLDKIKEYLDNKNISSYLISAGSSSSIFGDLENNNFKVTLRDYPSRQLNIKNAGLSISSIFEQKYEIDGEIYSHIINPKTGNSRPLYQYSLILDNKMDRKFPSTYIDGYSTGFINMNMESIKDFASEYGYKIAIGDDDIIYSSDGLF